MLLSQLGLLSPQQRANVHQIDQTPAFFRTLKNLDRTPEYVFLTLSFASSSHLTLETSNRRECISVGVLYLGKGQNKKRVWANGESSNVNPAYRQFLQASGWMVRRQAFLEDECC